MSQKVTKHTSRVTVRYAETDQMGVVYHANYLVWMEVGRVEYWRAAGLRYRDMEKEDGVLLVVAEANCRYRSPAVYDEEVIIRTKIGEANARMIRFEYELISADDGRTLASEREPAQANEGVEPQVSRVATEAFWLAARRRCSAFPMFSQDILWERSNERPTAEPMTSWNGE